MATVLAYVGLDMLNGDTFFGQLLEATSTRITISASG